MDIPKLNDAPLTKPQADSDQVKDRHGFPTPIAPSSPATAQLDTTAIEPPPPSPKLPASDVDADALKTLKFTPKIVEQLSTVYDPEIPVNIYEMGLIYDIIVDSAGVAVIKMTLTAPNCPAAVTLPAEVQGKVKSIEGINDARIDLVWEPPWSKDRMSEAAKLQLGIFD